MNLSYDKSQLVFTALFEDLVYNQQLNEERMLQPNYLPTTEPDPFGENKRQRLELF